MKSIKLLVILALFGLISYLIICTTGENINADDLERVERFDPVACFDKIWNIINEKFWDPDFNGLDWEDARKRYRPKALGASDHESFGTVINQMLAEPEKPKPPVGYHTEAKGHEQKVKKKKAKGKKSSKKKIKK